MANLWQGVRKALSQTYREKLAQWDKARPRYRQQAQRALADLQNRLGPEAKTRLAQHYAVLVICASAEEVHAWEKYLNERFTNVGESKGIAFVRWLKLKIPARQKEEEHVVPLIFWNGGGGMSEPFVYSHELAHIVDGPRHGDRLSKTPEWQRIWQNEKETFKRLFPDPKHLESSNPEKEAKEGFASALAFGWYDPKTLQRCPEIFNFLRKHALIVS